MDFICFAHSNRDGFGNAAQSRYDPPREAMLDHVYPVTEVYGSSSQSIDDAIRNAVSVAGQSIRNLEWFEVTEIRGHLASDGSVGHFQVGVKLGFRFERRPSS